MTALKGRKQTPEHIAKRVASRAFKPWPQRDPMERFWEKVGDHTDPAACWEWKASGDKHGYGAFYLDGALTKAPRAAWRLLVGQIPEGMWVCHRCDNPPCVNPAHLFLGSRADNLSDMRRKSRGKVPGAGWSGALGENHRAAKLTWALVAEARERFSRGEILSALARDYGVTPPTMWAVVHRKTWKVA